MLMGGREGVGRAGWCVIVPGVNAEVFGIKSVCRGLTAGGRDSGCCHVSVLYGSLIQP